VVTLLCSSTDTIAADGSSPPATVWRVVKLVLVLEVKFQAYGRDDGQDSPIFNFTLEVLHYLSH
jgi:hypothetical protein